MKIHRLYDALIRPFRKNRMARFMKSFSPDHHTTILDVGGTPFNWMLVGCPASITLLNIKPLNPTLPLPSNIRYVVGDGTALEYQDQEFDIVFSNSVIEHLSTFDNQVKFANEIRRVGKKIWVQTPSKSFFFEPHFLTPFIHYFSNKTQRKLIKFFTVWGILVRPTQVQVDAMVKEIRLLNYAEMKVLFPDCHIGKEKFLGMTKAYIVVRGD